MKAVEAEAEATEVCESFKHLNARGFLFIIIIIRHRVSLCSPCYSETHTVNQAGLEFTEDGVSLPLKC